MTALVLALGLALCPVPALATATATPVSCVLHTRWHRHDAIKCVSRRSGHRFAFVIVPGWRHTVWCLAPTRARRRICQRWARSLPKVRIRVRAR